MDEGTDQQTAERGLHATTDVDAEAAQRVLSGHRYPTSAAGRHGLPRGAVASGGWS